jgi:hypothetical protein
LNKIYQISNLLGPWLIENPEGVEIKIFIRKKVDEDKLEVPAMVAKHLNLVELYQGLPPIAAISAVSEAKSQT